MRTARLAVWSRTSSGKPIGSRRCWWVWVVLSRWVGEDERSRMYLARGADPTSHVPSG